MRPNDLHSLKDDMVAFIEGHAMRRLPAYITEDIPTILWQDDANPDGWKDFVEMAKCASAPFLTMSEIVLEQQDLELVLEQIQQERDSGQEPPEVEEVQDLANHVGKMGYIQLGFAHQGILFVHESSTGWYERYQQLLEFVGDFSDLAFGDDEEEESG